MIHSSDSNHSSKFAVLVVVGALKKRQSTKQSNHVLLSMNMMSTSNFKYEWI